MNKAFFGYYDSCVIPVFVFIVNIVYGGNQQNVLLKGSDYF